jgi:hypothetical protein
LPLFTNVVEEVFCEVRLDEFSEILAPASQLCYLVGERSGGKHVEEGEEKACDDE